MSNINHDTRTVEPVERHLIDRSGRFPFTSGRIVPRSVDVRRGVRRQGNGFVGPTGSRSKMLLLNSQQKPNDSPPEFVTLVRHTIPRPPRSPSTIVFQGQAKIDEFHVRGLTNVGTWGVRKLAQPTFAESTCVSANPCSRSVYLANDFILILRNCTGSLCPAKPK